MNRLPPAVSGPEMMLRFGRKVIYLVDGLSKLSKVCWQGETRMTATIRVRLFLAVSLIVSAALLKPCAADPSMDMEGGGGAGTQSCTCPTTGCTGVLTAS